MKHEEYKFTLLGKEIRVVPSSIDFKKRPKPVLVINKAIDFEIDAVGVVNHNLGAFGIIDTIEIKLSFGSFKNRHQIVLMDFIEMNKTGYMQEYILSTIFSQNVINFLLNKGAYGLDKRAYGFG